MGSRFVEGLDVEDVRPEGSIRRDESTSTGRERISISEKDTASRNMFVNAAAATDKEHRMTLLQGVRLYPKAIGWSMLISSLCAMEGYDISLIGNFYAFPPFNQQFGELQPGGGYQVPARWQTGLSCGAQGGQIIGLIINGFLTERIGYRKVILLSLCWLTAITALFYSARSLEMLLAAEILAGVPWGVFQAIAISYAAEVCPVALRGYLTTWANSCWGWGQIIGIAVIRSQFGRTDDWAWRLPYALMWMWYPPLLLGVYLAPESPWWLVRVGKIEEARKSLARLTSHSDNSDFEVDETVDMIRHTTELEMDAHSGASYADCFRGTNLRRTLLVCGIWATQNFSGNTFSNYSTYFFEQAGLGGTAAYDFALGQYAINTVGVFGAWGLMSLGVGRRTLFVYGLCGLCATLAIIGFVGIARGRAEERTLGLVTGSLMLVWATIYQISVGTIAFSLVAEMSTRRLQVKTIALGRAAYNVAAIAVNILTPYMINPTAWNWRNYAGFFWSGTCFLCIVFAYFCVPEPSGRSFAELDLLFERKVPARKFAETKVDVFEEGAQVGLIKFTALSNQAQAHALFPRYDPSNPSFIYHEPAIAQVLILGSFLYLLNLFGWAGQKLLNAGLLGQILLGVIYGTPLAGWLDEVWLEAFVALGYVGLLIVVFEAGIHSSVSHLESILPLSLCIAVTGVMLPMGLSFILGPLANFSYLHCFAAGSAMASTSLGTTLAVLSPQSLGFDLRRTRLGTALISAAVIDDIIAFILSKMLSVIGNNPSASGAVLGIQIGRTIGVTLGIGLISLLATNYVLKPVYRAMRARGRLWEDKSWGGDGLLVFCMTLLWLGLVAGAGYAGTSPLFGAYLSGLVVAYVAEEEREPDPTLKLPHRFPHAATIDVRTPNMLARASTLPETTSVGFLTSTSTTPLGGKVEDDKPTTSLTVAFEHYVAPALFRLLLPIFFASIGYSIPFVPLWKGSVLWRGIIYTILMTLGKVGCGLWLVVWTKSWKCWRGAVVLGLAMVARGEIGLLISQIAYTTSTPLLPGDEFLIVIWAIVLCTVAGPVAVGIAIRRWGKTILIGSWD